MKPNIKKLISQIEIRKNALFAEKEKVDSLIDELSDIYENIEDSIQHLDDAKESLIRAHDSLAKFI